MLKRTIDVWFVVTLLLICWYGMLILHESGHALAAAATGGRVQRVVLHPLQISRTDVSPNPAPLIVVWMGPLIGCLASWFPYGVALRLTPVQEPLWRQLTLFFAGFCCIANGAYIGVGSVEGIGDCGVMLRYGSPQISLIVFGVLAAGSGFLAWHKLGSPRSLFRSSPLAPPTTVAILTAVLSASLVVQLVVFG